MSHRSEEDFEDYLFAQWLNTFALLIVWLAVLFTYMPYVGTWRLASPSKRYGLAAEFVSNTCGTHICSNRRDVSVSKKTLNAEAAHVGPHE